ncbi:MAG: hypothetical protein D6795_11200, partial [Deltaproteobacteria bacterium]
MASEVLHPIPPLAAGTTTSSGGKTMNHTGRLPRHFRVLLPGALGTLFFLLLSGQQACVPQDNDGDGWVAGEGNLADC